MCDVAVGSRPTRATPRPRWSLLYRLALVMVGALVAVEIGASPGATRTMLECGLAFGGFAAMALWVRSNRIALDQQEWCECAAEKITVHVILSRRPEPEPAVEEELVVEHEEVVVEALSVAG